MRVFALIALALTAAGCFSPDYQSGHLQCSGAQDCPPGFHCASDNRCYRAGEEPDLAVLESPDLGMTTDLGGADLTGASEDLASPPDLTPPPPVLYPPAAVLISSGGGSGVKNGNQLNISLPGSTAVGLSTAPSGATLNFGFFSNDSVE
jgi:hypothetical protein